MNGHLEREQAYFKGQQLTMVLNHLHPVGWSSKVPPLLLVVGQLTQPANKNQLQKPWLT